MISNSFFSCIRGVLSKGNCRIKRLKVYLLIALFYHNFATIDIGRSKIVIFTKVLSDITKEKDRI